MADNGRLTARQQTGIESLLSSASVRDASTSSGIGERTFYRWLSDPAFTTELNTRRRVLMDTALNTLRTHIAAAVETLAGLLDAEHEGVRRASAKDILDMAIKSSERTDLLERIEQLERAQNDSKDKN